MGTDLDGRGFRSHLVGFTCRTLHVRDSRGSAVAYCCRLFRAWLFFHLSLFAGVFQLLCLSGTFDMSRLVAS